MIYKFFILELYFETFWYYFILEFALYSYYGDKKNGLLLNHLFQRLQEHQCSI